MSDGNTAIALAPQTEPDAMTIKQVFEYAERCMKLPAELDALREQVADMQSALDKLSRLVAEQAQTANELREANERLVAEHNDNLSRIGDSHTEIIASHNRRHDDDSRLIAGLTEALAAEQFKSASLTAERDGNAEQARKWETEARETQETLVRVRREASDYSDTLAQTRGALEAFRLRAETAEAKLERIAAVIGPDLVARAA